MRRIITADEKECKVSIFIEGSYDTLHDICCQKGRQLQQQKGSKDFSVERSRAVRKFFYLSKELNRVNNLLLHIDSFKDHVTPNGEFNDVERGPAVTLPDRIAKGIALFQDEKEGM